MPVLHPVTTSNPITVVYADGIGHVSLELRHRCRLPPAHGHRAPVVRAATAPACLRLEAVAGGRGHAAALRVLFSPVSTSEFFVIGADFGRVYCFLITLTPRTWGTIRVNSGVLTEENSTLRAALRSIRLMEACANVPWLLRSPARKNRPDEAGSHDTSEAE